GERAGGILHMHAEGEGCAEIARRARGTPRIANRLLRRVRDYAEVKGTGVISTDIARAALNMLEVDALGLDSTDHRLLKTMMQIFDGGPVGMDSLAAALNEDAGTFVDVV